MEDIGQRGKIYAIRCKNFVTYDEVVFFPNEYLNIIIGPNGTGKSTLVSAIVLGLGGTPKLLSRSTDLMDYIKYGKDKAEIEIHLYKTDGDCVTITRTFDKNGMDIFKVDDKQLSHKAAIQLIKKEYRVQIDNLCQFLPQDRVQDFAKMNPQEILHNTQLSSCPTEVKEQFDKLLELRNQQKNVGSDTEKKRKQVDELKLKNDALRPQIENIQARKKLVEEIEMCLRKRTWLEYDELNNKLKEYETDMSKAQERLDESNKKLAPRQTEVNQIKAIKKGMEDKMAVEASSKSKSSVEIEKFEEHLGVLERELKSVDSDQKDMIAAAREQKAELNIAGIALKAVAKDLETTIQLYGNNQDALKNEIAQHKSTTLKLNKKKSTIEQELENHQNLYRNQIQYRSNSIKNKLENLQNIGRKKMELLANIDNDAFLATQWLEENQNLFKGRVFRPILLELSVVDQKNAKYIENTVPLRDLIAFTFEKSEDVKVFIEEVRVKKQLKVNTIQSDAAQNVQFAPRLSIDTLQKYGFHTYLIDLVTGPPPILNYLCKTYKFHNIPLGTDHIFENANQVPNEITSFFTPNHRFLCRFSQYSQQKSSITTEIRPRNLLDAGVDMRAVELCQKTLDEISRKGDGMKTEISNLEYQIKVVEDEITSVNNERRKVEEKVNSVKKAQANLQRHEMKYAQLRQKQIDVVVEKDKFMQRKVKILRNRMELHKKIVAQLAIFQSSSTQTEFISQRIRIFQHEKGNIGAEIDALLEEVRTRKGLVQTIERHFAAQKDKCKAKLTEAQRLTNNQNPSAKNFVYKSQFSKLPATVEELEATLNEVNARLHCMRAETQGIQEEFDQRNAEIERLNEQIENTETNKAKLQQDMEVLHQQWYPFIQGVIKRINTTFQGFMHSMGFSGEVCMEYKNEHEYSDYGIKIMVKYRNDEKLQALDRFVQSGGERAVAIAIYTLSLQQLSQVPFRCVDEINQGMDPRNERRVFKMLVKETCQKGKSQYFFVTPKLLPNLPYDELMTVHIVHNGKFINESTVFCSDDLIEDE